MADAGPLDFTADQEDAIRWKALDACVVAGPGSGKTTVLVERFRRLVDVHSVDPSRILAITFTEKAAANMKAKLAEKFRHHPVKLRDLESAWVSTIHGFCARLLHENAIAAGVDPKFAVPDAREADDMQFDCISAALDELTANRREEALALIEALQKPDIAGELRNAWDGIRSAGKTVEDVRRMPCPPAQVTPPDHGRGPAAVSSGDRVARDAGSWVDTERVAASMSAASGGSCASRELALRLRTALRGWPAKLSKVQTEQYSDLMAWAPVLESADTLGLAELRELIRNSPINLRRVPEASKPPLEALRDDFKKLIARAVDTETAPFRAIVFDVLSRFDALYAARKAEAGVLDFNDLERRAIELLRRNPDVEERVRRQFRQVMLDEFQDINEQQAELIDRVRGQEVFFAVGDVNQAIYGFRHARPEIFAAYQKEIAAKGKHSARLMDNFRSRASILRCVEALLNPLEGIQPRELRPGGAFTPKAEPSVEILRVLDDDAEEGGDAAGNREARWIAHRVVEIGREFRDYAVLCRNSESMRPILEAFDAAKIPYVCGRRQSFLLSREGRDIAAVLNVLANPRDSVALATVLRSILVGLSDEALLRLRLIAGSITSGLNVVAFDAARLNEFSPDDADRLRCFIRNLRRWRADQPVVPLDVLISRIVSDCGRHWNPGSSEGENIEAFLRLARAKGSGRRLLDFLRELEGIENAVNAESDLSDEDQGNCVQVMTAHAAKGLEFKVAILAGMHKGTRRTSAAVTFTPEDGLGLRWKDAADDRGSKDSWAEANGLRLKRREEEEANRLLYVAMTRAEDHLILSYSQGKQRPQNWARLLSDHFDLWKLPPSPDSVTLHRDGFDVSVLVADADPPPIDAWSSEEREQREIQALPRPRLDDGHDTSIVVTSLAVFAACPRRYYLQRYLGWNAGRPARFDPEELPLEEDDIPAAELGSMVHEILAGKEGEYPPEARELAEVFTRGELGRRAAASKSAGREWDFIADIDDTLVRGSIDLWFEESGGIVVVDYKTDDVAAADVPRRAAEYEPQLALYALAIEKAFGRRPAAACLHFLRPDVVREVRLTDAALDRARDLLAGVRDAQDSLRFDLNPGSHCARCRFYRSMCPGE